MDISINTLGNAIMMLLDTIGNLLIFSHALFIKTAKFSDNFRSIQ